MRLPPPARGPPRHKAAPTHISTTVVKAVYKAEDPRGGVRAIPGARGVMEIDS